MDTQKQYVNHDGLQCPKCSNPTIRGGEFDLETYNRDCECLKCGYKWFEIYRLAGYEEADPDLWKG
jgi:DNA-directed RNA polymerase subunit RPC12/RpoP